MRYEGHNLPNRVAPDGRTNFMDSSEECRESCKKYVDCVGWTWYTYEAGGSRPKQCWLKEKVVTANKKSDPGTISGLRECTGGDLYFNLRL